MAKAVLVMDMPECCADCQLADDDPSGLYCMFADDYYDGSDSSEDRASFCPLRNCQSIGARSVKKVSRIGY